jgi:tagatose 6-phosphate kinase
VARMIATVTLNLALDITYTVAEVEWHAANRVRTVAERAGGKGVNVSRVLAALGHATVVCGFAGGPTGDAIAAELAAARLEAVLTPIAGTSRRTVVVVDSSAGDATGFWEPGPTVEDEEWSDFLRTFETVLADARAVVVSGSLPPGIPVDAYAELCRRAREAGVPAVLDADGEALRAGLAGRPALIKPNSDELARAAGRRDAVAAAQRLRAVGADSVVVSRGPDGMLAVTPEGIWRAVPAERMAGNPTGAGDAAVAALAAGVVEGRTWPERLADAVALSAAAVGAPVAGSFDEELYRRNLARVLPEHRGPVAPA